MNRDRFTAQEEMLTKRIARVRIHVERAIERMKKNQIIGEIVPFSFKLSISQIVHIIGFLVNYQEPLVKWLCTANYVCGIENIILDV